ncbi:MAG: hypothetical protein AAGK97_10400 [Bacteroidota bacterium]
MRCTLLILCTFVSMGLLAQELNVTPTLVNTEAQLFVKGQSTDTYNFRVANSDGLTHFFINPNGKVGILQPYSNVGLNVRASITDVQALQVESNTGDKLFTVSPTGRSGINHAYSNLAFNVRGAGDFGVFAVENSAGAKSLRINEDSRGGLNHSYSNVGFVVRGVEGDLYNFKVESSTGTDRLLINETGRVGINAITTGTGFTVRGVENDVYTMKVENDLGTDLFTINPTGHLGLNTGFSNVTANIRAVAGDAKYLNVEDATGTDLLTVQAGATIVKDLSVTGNKSFLIDHPQDPENKYLQHFCMEGPKAFNVYQGTLPFDENGKALVQLPEYFESLNIEFVYQLTCVGGYAPIYIEKEIENNQFTIAGGKPNMKVSWVVTATRNDPHTAANRSSEVIIKPKSEQGSYLNPEVYNKH